MTEKLFTGTLNHNQNKTKQNILLTGKSNTTIEVITPKISKVELWFLCMTHCLIVLYNCMKFHLKAIANLQTQNSIANDQREITPKIYKAELWFLCMTHCLIVLYNCMKFHLKSCNGCQLTERTRNSIANDQREITPKMSKAELWFLCITYCLFVSYKCMKFQPNSFNSLQLTEQTRNCIYLCYKGDNLKNIHARVMVLVHDMSTLCALQMYEVSLKYL